MSLERQKFYPGEGANAQEILLLAHEYRLAANHLRSLRRRAEPRSLAPFRWAAIHAVELYLNAYLLNLGRLAPEIRGLQHDLRRRVKLAVSAGLKLKKRTVQDLQAISTSREYLTMRYEPRLPVSACQPNGLEATLADVAKKVAEAVNTRGRTQAVDARTSQLATDLWRIGS